ncbi:MAG: SOS response-associated peptidase [Bacteroidia bacterium]|nr:SOS response-associated peptidase [Bacteroidia bacterium]
MCGRYTLTQRPEPAPAAEVPAFKPRYNIAPTQAAPVVLLERPGDVVYHHWGLIPHWARDAAGAARLINARAETLTEKPAFRDLIRRQRCLVPADGFYEWKTSAGGKKPYRITVRNGELVYFAGLYDRWQAPDGRMRETFVIITTHPNALMVPIHDRMPVILSQAAAQRWLDPAADWLALQADLVPYPGEQMVAYPVSARVGQVRADDPGLILPDTSTDLFGGY